MHPTFRWTTFYEYAPVKCKVCKLKLQVHFSLLPHLMGCFIASGIVLFSCQENAFGVHLSLHRVIYTNLSDLKWNSFKLLEVIFLNKMYIDCHHSTVNMMECDDYVGCSEIHLAIFWKCLPWNTSDHIADWWRGGKYCIVI